jgi:hypothetical protein
MRQLDMLLWRSVPDGFIYAQIQGARVSARSVVVGALMYIVPYMWLP